MVPYRARRLLTWPRRWWLRRRDGGAPVIGSMLEAMSYRRSMYRFIAATAANPGLLHDAELDAGSVVVDGGAYEGEWALPVARRYGCTVHAFEPVDRAADVLVERAAGLDVVVHRCGLGRRDETVTIAKAGPGSAVGGTRPAAFGSATVELRDAAAALDDLGVERLSLLKLNIEGGEYDVLERLAETGWLARIDQVSVQFHEWLPHAYRRRRTIRRTLRATHDEVWCHPWVWELWRRR